MRYELIVDLLHHLDSKGSLGIGNADGKTTAILESLAIPIELKRLLQWYWTTSGGQVGPYVLCSLNEIPAIHDYDRLLKYEMIPIGDAANGDILVIRFVDEDCAVGLVSHDQLWEGESDPLQAYAEVTPCIDEYLWRVAESRYLPIDYYAASELVELRRSISESKTL